MKFERILICGDINLHLDNTKAKLSIQFSELLSSYGLHQFVMEATHKNGHSLDAVISSNKLIGHNIVSVFRQMHQCSHHVTPFL